MKLTPSKTPIRPTLKDLEYYELRESIKRHGQLVPILCRPSGEVVDGNRRLKVCQELGIEPTYVARDLQDIEVLVAQLRLNDLSVKDKRAGIFRLIRENKLDRWSSLCHNIGVHSNRIYRDLGFDDLADSVWEAVKADAIDLEVARLLCKLPKTRQRELLTVATTNPVSDLVETIGREVRKAWQGKIERRVNRKNSPDQPYLRSQKEIYNEVKQPTETMRLLVKENVTTPFEAFQLALKWTLKLDPESVKRRTV